MANKRKKSTTRNYNLIDEPILQPPEMLTARDLPQPQSARMSFDMSNYEDTTVATGTHENRRLRQRCGDKEKSPIVATGRTNKRIYNECPSNKQAPNVVSHNRFKKVQLNGHTSMNSLPYNIFEDDFLLENEQVNQRYEMNQPYDILREEARIEKELMNGSYEMDSHIMARIWEESRSDDELMNESCEMNIQPSNRVREEPRVEDEIMNGSYDQEHDQGDDIALKSKKNVRGPTYMESVWGRPSNLERYHVEYNEFGQAIDGESSTLSHFLGTIARNGKYCPIDLNDWRKVPKENKKVMLGVVKSRFEVPITAEKWILTSIGDRWKNWKHDLKKDYWKKDVPIAQLIAQQKDKRVNLDQWVKLLMYWDSDEAKEASKRNKKARAKKTMKQITGKTSFAQVRAKMTKELGRSPNRYELFGACFEKSSDDASRKYLEMQERNNQLPEGSQDPVGPNDVFAQTMGPDRPGHVRMMGKGISPSDVWGDLPRSRSNRILMEQQAQITQLKSMILAQGCGDSQIPSRQHEISVNSQSNHATTNLPLKVGAYVHLKSLFNPQKNVAKGCINSIDPCSEVGGQLLGSNWCEVNVKVVFNPDEQLIRPYDNLQKMADVLGGIIAWPCNLVTPIEN